MDEHQHCLPVMLSLPLLRPACRSLAAVASTCRHLRTVTWEVVPGMRLMLFPHQRAALKWMLAKEGRQAALPHPLARRLVTKGGLVCWADLATGELQVGPCCTVGGSLGGVSGVLHAVLCGVLHAVLCGVCMLCCVAVQALRHLVSGPHLGVVRAARCC